MSWSCPVSYTHLDVYKRQILVINILDTLPDDLMTLYEHFVSGQPIALGIVISLVILALLFGLVLFVVYLQGGERRIPVQYLSLIHI